MTRAHNNPSEIRRDARYIKAWGKWLVNEEALYYEGSTSTLSLRANNGDVLAKYPSLMGPLVISEGGRRILSCEMDIHILPSPALLFDDAGRLVKEIPPLAEGRDCGQTEDGLLFWLLYSVVETGEPVSVALFIDTNGTEIVRTPASVVPTITPAVLRQAQRSVDRDGRYV